MNKLVYKIIYGGGLVFNLCKWVVVAIILLIIISSFWVSIFVVDGASMEPNLHDGEVVMMSKSFFRGEQKPQRGDAVIVQYPGDPDNKRYVKRVIGLPGERLQADSGKVYIDGTVLRESYIPASIATMPQGDWKIEQNQYFLMGDNRENSNDSRYFGTVETRFFIGKATSVVLPSPRNVSAPVYFLNMSKK